ncbi:MAG: HEPN domain-containing protein [Chloroflexi bacterium]|nr:HEPN domain-containing protein [Chloroflexota bacterium]
MLRAQHDLASARVLSSGEQRILDTAAYHCQQAAEKAVKGYLVYRDEPFERIHDVEVLVRLAAKHEAGFELWVEAGMRLTPYATLFRYPGPVSEPTHEQFDRALDLAEGLYAYVLSLLPKQVWPSE